VLKILGGRGVKHVAHSRNYKEKGGMIGDLGEHCMECMLLSRVDSPFTWFPEIRVFVVLLLLKRKKCCICK
jgi:hypothetical protein